MRPALELLTLWASLGDWLTLLLLAPTGLLANQKTGFDFGLLAGWLGTLISDACRPAGPPGSPIPPQGSSLCRRDASTRRPRTPRARLKRRFEDSRPWVCHAADAMSNYKTNYRVNNESHLQGQNGLRYATHTA